MPDGKTYGHICGRFQPFHKKHLEYAKLAAEIEEVDTLMIGVTNADPGHIEKEEEDMKRHKQKHNPFMYHERMRMAEEALKDPDISIPFKVLPFPINRPELWKYYAPEDAVHCIGVVDKWNKEKASKIERAGRKVVRKKMTSYLNGEKVRATRIREKMAEGGEWQYLVPDAVADFIERNELEKRVMEIYKN